MSGDAVDTMDKAFVQHIDESEDKDIRLDKYLGHIQESRRVTTTRRETRRYHGEGPRLPLRHLGTFPLIGSYP